MDLPEVVIRNVWPMGPLFKSRGRASRQEFWYFFVAQLLVSLVLTAIVLFAMKLSSYLKESPLTTFLLIDLCILLFLPTIAAVGITIRRLHDIDESGAWILLPIIGAALFKLSPVFGLIQVGFFFLLMKKGTTGSNKFGPDPLTEATHNNGMSVST